MTFNDSDLWWNEFSPSVTLLGRTPYEGGFGVLPTTEETVWSTMSSAEPEPRMTLPGT